MNISAAIISGGMARRFGSDKTLAILRGKPLVQWVAEGLSFTQDRLIIAKDTSKYEFLQNFALVSDIYAEQCPLVGIISAFSRAKHDHLFIISADMPLFPFELVPKMAEEMGNADICAPIVNGKIYPCAAIYHRRALPALERNFLAGKYKLMRIFDELMVKTLDEVFFADTSGFVNINTKEDLQNI